MEIIKKDSGSGITFTGEDGQSKTLEEFVQEEEEKEKDKEVEEYHNEETGVIRRRTIYREPHDRQKERRDRPTGAKIYTQEEINTQFNERNLKRMAQSKGTPLVQLVIGCMADGAWYSPQRIADKIKEVDPNNKSADASQVSWRISQLRQSPVKPFIEKRNCLDSRVNEYSLARPLVVNLSANDIYALYQKRRKDVTRHTLAVKFPDIATYLERKDRQDKWGGVAKDVSHETKKIGPIEKPVEAEPEINEPIVSLANEVKRVIAEKLGVDVNISGRIEIAFKFGIERESD